MIELMLFLHLKTGTGPKHGTLKVSRDGDESRAAWLPKSSCSFRELGNGRVAVTMSNEQAVLLFGAPLPLMSGAH